VTKIIELICENIDVITPLLYSIASASREQVRRILPVLNLKDVADPSWVRYAVPTEVESSSDAVKFKSYPIMNEGSFWPKVVDSHII
jgi:hypothetical protein